MKKIQKKMQRGGSGRSAVVKSATVDTIPEDGEMKQEEMMAEDIYDRKNSKSRDRKHSKDKQKKLHKVGSETPSVTNDKTQIELQNKIQNNNKIIKKGQYFQKKNSQSTLTMQTAIDSANIDIPGFARNTYVFFLFFLFFFCVCLQRSQNVCVAECLAFVKPFLKTGKSM